MLKIIYAQDIDRDKTADKKLYNARLRHYNNTKRHTIKAYRVYKVNNKDYTAKGYFIDNKKLYKDRISFIYTSDYKTAKKTAYKLLKDSAEICIACESLLSNKLYIIYRDKIQVLKIKYSYKTYNKRQAIKYVKELTAINGGATIEFKAKRYIITSYK